MSIFLNHFRHAFGDSDLFKKMDMLKVALRVGRVAVYGLLGAFALFAVVAIPVLLAVGAMATMIAGPFIILSALIGGLVMGAIAVFSAFADNWSAGFKAIKKELWGFWSDITELDWASMGGAIIDGILSGLTAGLAPVAEAVGNIGQAAWDKFASVLGIHSPSKVFAELGAAIPAGVAQGVNQNAGAGQDAAAGIVQPPPAAESGGGQRGGSNITIEVGGINITAQPGQQAQAIAMNIRQELELVFEQLALQLGAAIP